MNKNLELRRDRKSYVYILTKKNNDKIYGYGETKKKALETLKQNIKDRW